MKFYLEPTEKVFSAVESSEKGLTSAEAEQRLAKYGKNKLKEAEKDSLFKKFINSLADPMIIMLLVAAAIQAVVTVVESGANFSFRDFADVLVILVVVIINTVMSLVQDSKAEAAMDALMEMTAATSHVLRDGEVVTIKSEDVVIGDIVVLEAGDAVPADCRIIESHSMKVEEAALTGESVPVTKLIDALHCTAGSDDIALGDRKNMLYSGSTIVYGRGKAVVTAVGMDTEMGKIADALSDAEQEQTPLQKKMAELSKFLTKLVIAICVVVFAVGLVESLVLSNEPFSWELLGNTALSTFISAIALAVAAIPEGLPAVVTIILSIGVTAMSKRQALIRKLTAVETLGCTQIICSDKTGTLTQNKMTVVDHFGDNEKLIAEAMALCTDAQIDDAGKVTGEPTEAALVGYAYALGMSKNDLVKASPRIGEAPFDSGRKIMSTVHKTASGIVQYTKGVADMVLADDNFATIVNAVEEGKKIYDNVCKVLQFQLSTNMSEVIIMFVASILNFQLLEPVHLLWINMVTDSLPGLALGMEKAEGNLMKRKPRATTDGIFSHGAGFDMAWQGIYLAIVELAAYVIGYRLEVGSFENMFFGGADGYCINAMSMAFLTVNFAEMMCAINMRSRTGSIFSKSMFKNMNWWLVGAFAVTTALTLIAVYLPGLSDEVFDIERGTFQTDELLISAGLAASTIPVFEIGKAIRRAVERKKERNAA